MIPEKFWVLLARKKSGEATATELEELRRMLRSNTLNGYTSDVIDSLWEARMNAVPERVPEERQWERIVSRTKAGSGSAPLAWITRYGWQVAAGFLLVCSLAVVRFFYKQDKPRELTNTALRNLNHVATRPGSKSKVELPDGTQVWLNGESRITYANGDFGKSNREVVLVGEAFFDVVKNEQIPFIIHTGPVNITVKGTAFNVKAYPTERTIETSLVRGLVEITTTGDPDRKIMLKPNEKIIIPVQRDSKHASVRTTDSTGDELYSITKIASSSSGPSEIAWIRNQLVFDDEPFESIAPKMESWYHIVIHFTDESLKKRRFSGVIEKETIRETLEAMQLSNHFSYTIKGNELWVGKNNPN